MPFSHGTGRGAAATRHLPRAVPGRYPASPTHRGFPCCPPAQHLRSCTFHRRRERGQRQLLPLLVPDQEVAEAAKATSRRGLPAIYTQGRLRDPPGLVPRPSPPADHVTCRALRA
ncbi:hypothetical protein QJS66_15955 [Kocuria rhizophila]|nr:hypothetical protein QJS66_15955 [Kocuria rhizophila]